jgi:antitoxin component YwqK of YwqJK toxin-antitoxin module
MELRSLIFKLLQEQVDQNVENLKIKYVGEGKPISEEDFNNLVEVTGNKFYLLSWLTKKVGTGIIKAEDIYKYKEYFNIYEKNKRKFKYKDIHLYKTADDLKKFLDEVLTIREGDIIYSEISGQDNFVSQNDIEKLENSGGVKYLGIYDNGDFKYQVFEIFGVNQNVWKLYRDILGRCKYRDQGAKIDICTVGHYKYFKSYLTDPKGSSYFLLFNLDDVRSPYQLHYESGQFMDRQDREHHNIKQLNFFKFIGDKVPRYSLENEKFLGVGFEIPVPNKGYLDDEGRKQGQWKHHDYGSHQVVEIQTYVDDELFGPFITFLRNGQVETKGTKLSFNQYMGDYEEYSHTGRLRKKGTYSEKGEKIGKWTYSNWDKEVTIVDYDTVPMKISGLTANGKVRYTSQMKGAQENPSPYGPTFFYGRSGKLVAKGNMGAKGRYLGKWIYYFPNGTIRSEGSFKEGFRNGKWTDVLKTTDGQTYTFVANFAGYPIEKVQVYDKNGNYLKKINPNKINPPYWLSNRLSLNKFN